uniref:Uncharacterized protein n=1 Tax=Arundo donax TaxID=35708 RepID=A0A0A9B493_ARUDO
MLPILSLQSWPISAASNGALPIHTLATKVASDILRFDGYFLPCL